MANIEDAKKFARRKHKGGKRRRFSCLSEVSHPNAVAKRLVITNASPEAIMGGYLHDTLEDTDTTPAELKKVFGNTVAKIVQQVSIPDNVRGEKARTDFWNRRVSRMTDDALLVKLADKLENFLEAKKMMKQIISFINRSIRMNKSFIATIEKKKPEILKSKKHGRLIKELNSSMKSV